jgi:ElaB/YqjD/DUF883 family membrane-anchored ribosome-binding protein
MQKHTRTAASDVEGLAADAKALLSATGHLAGETVEAARKRLTMALDRTKESWERIQDRAVDGAKAADGAIRRRPYHAVGVALGVGAIVGFCLARRSR